MISKGFKKKWNTAGSKEYHIDYKNAYLLKAESITTRRKR